MQSRFERFSYDIFQIYKYWHKIAAEEMKHYGLKGSSAVYLTAISRCEGGITAAQLGDICGRDKADVSRTMSAMKEKGLVVREEVNKNYYRARLTLTEEGLRAAEHIEKRAGLAVELASKDISEEHRTILYEALEMISLNLQSISEEGLPNHE